ncbi:MAG TPA: GNAT family N-acetyltransferase [Gaiellaceae bacterium]|jgi:RimJ/RimL family protein N-acetyltransferase|nr:GNAT family N-acetyltransferase [Gaiellaceae bacterium]
MRPDWPLETERLVLRPYTDGDLENLHSIYSLPEVARWLYYGPTTLEESRQKLARKIGGSELTEDHGLSAAVELRDGTYVGDVVLFYGSVEHKTVEVGFSIDPRQHGKGYATEAARALIDWAFDQGFHRVVGRLEARNTASARVLEKLGMRREALLVENEWVKGEWQSELVYAMLEHEWR